MNPNLNLHNLSLKEEIDKKYVYNIWADSYENYVKNLDYQGPQSLVFTLNNYFSNIQINKKIDILDFGCGTGLLGLEIKKNFIKDFNLDGIDISTNMIEKSKQKNIYSNLWNLDIGKDKLDKKYGVIVSSGVFLEGHAPLSLINNLIDFTNKDGLLFITFRQSYIDNNKQEFDLYTKKNQKIKIIKNLDINYLPNIKCALYIFKKI